MQSLKGALTNLRWGCQSMPRLDGKVFIVTGSNAGLGFVAAKHLVEKGGYVIMATRNAEKAQAAIDEIQQAVAGTQAGRVEFMQLDLASLSSVRQFADAFKARGLPLHCLIDNAGVMAPEAASDLTQDGFELTVGTNFFGHFYLTHLLLDKLRQSAPSRLVVMSSAEEARAYVPWEDLSMVSREAKRDIDGYAISQLLKLMFGKEMARRLKGSGVDAYVVHPGMARTELFRKQDFSKPETTAHDLMQKLGGQSAESGALPVLYAATEPRLQGNPGGFYGSYYARFPNWFSANFPMATNLFNKMRISPVNPAAKDPSQTARLYEGAADLLEQKTGQPLPNRLPATQ